MMATKRISGVALAFTIVGIISGANAAPDSKPSSATAIFHGTPAQADSWLAAHPAPEVCATRHHPEAGSWYSGNRAKAWSGCTRDGYYRDVRGKRRLLRTAARQ